MSEVVLTEIIEDMDVDNDGEVSLVEYIADIIKDEDEDSVKDSERDNFNNNLDHDKSGKLDRDEVCSTNFPDKLDTKNAVDILK